MGQDNQESTPDWVMLGVPTPDGRVAVYASKELNQAELTEEADEDDLQEWLRYGSPSHSGIRHRIELTVEMRTYVVVTADTYAEALRGLLNVWSPEPEQPALDPAVKAIAS